MGTSHFDYLKIKRVTLSITDFLKLKISKTEK